LSEKKHMDLNLAEVGFWQSWVMRADPKLVLNLVLDLNLIRRLKVSDNFGSTKFSMTAVPSAY
jgi:metal-sulfur cluster biosynthetic enzyme